MSDDFDFGEGDTVRVTVHEGSPHGSVVAEFMGECVGFGERPGPSSDEARFKLPFGTANSLTVKPYEGEFEVVE